MNIGPRGKDRTKIRVVMADSHHRGAAEGEQGLADSNREEARAYSKPTRAKRREADVECAYHSASFARDSSCPAQREQNRPPFMWNMDSIAPAFLRSDNEASRSVGISNESVDSSNTEEANDDQEDQPVYMIEQNNENLRIIHAKTTEPVHETSTCASGNQNISG